MKRKNYIMGGLMLLASALQISCSSEEGEINLVGQPVKFSTSSTQTRTIYDGSDKRQINWVTGDHIKIHSEQCPTTHEAPYKVAGTTNQGEILPVSEGTQLYWNDDKGLSHVFAAAYPASAEYLSGDQFKFLVPLAQTNDANFMQNAYMVARNPGVTSNRDKNVLLTFKPIMTTLEIILQGATGNASLYRTINSLTFKTNMPCDGDNKFTYNTASDNVVDAAVEKTITWTPASTMTIDGSATDVPNTKSFLLFIPYVAINSSNPVAITIKFTDETSTAQTYKATLSPGSTIGAGKKVSIKLPRLMKEEYPDGISGSHFGFEEIENLEF